MYQIGDRVLYSSHGVCQIVSTQERVIDRRRIEYFVLEPIGQPGCQFLIPSGNPAVLAKLRPLLTKDELDAMLHSEAVHQDFWISDENARKLRYKELISSADRTAILGMVYTLNLHKKLLLEAGRKFHQCDENFMNDAKKLLSGEFALVLGIERSQVEEYILSAMENNEGRS